MRCRSSAPGLKHAAAGVGQAGPDGAGESGWRARFERVEAPSRFVDERPELRVAVPPEVDEARVVPGRLVAVSAALVDVRLAQVGGRTQRDLGHRPVAERGEPLQCFVVAAEGTRAADVVRLIREVSDRVAGRTGIQLEPEVRVLGDLDLAPR